MVEIVSEWLMYRKNVLLIDCCSEMLLVGSFSVLVEFAVVMWCTGVLFSCYHSCNMECLSVCLSVCLSCLFSNC